MRLYILALQFLTIIPLPFSISCDRNTLGRSTIFFPLVGITIGGMMAFDYLCLSPFLNRSLLAAIIVASLAIITGALHLDGMADVCDAFAARGERDRFLAVMKDSHTGAAGAVGVVLTLLLKWQGLAAVAEPLLLPALLLFPTIGRTAQLFVMSGSKHARDNGLGNLFITGMGKRELLTGLLFCTITITILAPLRGFISLALSITIAFIVRRYFHDRIGGITGDIIGFTSELSEIATLIVFSAALK